MMNGGGIRRYSSQQLLFDVPPNAGRWAQRGGVQRRDREIFVSMEPTTPARMRGGDVAAAESPGQRQQLSPRLLDLHAFDTELIPDFQVPGMYDGAQKFGYANGGGFDDSDLSFATNKQMTASEKRVVIKNKHGEKLVGVLHDTGSNKIVVLCHGFIATKNDSLILDLTAALTKKGISVFRFDFSGNGESEGEFEYGNYRKEADDLYSVVSYLYQEKYDVTAIVGHSKGGDVVVLYASIYDDVHMVVNVSGRFDLEKGIEERIGKGSIDRINKEGYLDVKDKSENVQYRVTKESLMERLNTDMRAASVSISKECRFFTVHGSGDETIPVEDAYEFAKLIPNHKLRVIEGANHNYTTHRKEVTDAVVDFITSSEAGDT